MAKRVNYDDISPAMLLESDIKEVRSIAGKTFSKANKRIKALKKAGLYEISPAIYSLGDKAKFSSKFLNKEMLVVEIVRARNFMQMPESTVRGAKQFASDFVYQFNNDAPYYDKAQSLSSAQWNKIHKTVEELNTEPGGIYRDPSEMIVYLVEVLYSSNDKRRMTKGKLKEAVNKRFPNKSDTSILTIDLEL